MTDRRTRPHVIVLHRWRDRYAEYENYIDHERCAVSYVTTDVGRAGVPDAAAGVVEVAATDHLPTVRAAVDQLARQEGDPRTVVALKEDDLPVAAVLRQERGCGGMSPHHLERFTDKLVMARVLAAAGVEMPAFAPAADRAAIGSFAHRHGWPIVVKPRVGSASDGVRTLHGPADLAELPLSDSRPMLVQQFHSGQIFHVDGVFDGERLGAWEPSRYLSTCLDFRSGAALGSIEDDDPGRRAAIGRFTERVLRALTRQALVFHLEIFVSAAAAGGWACSFLEIGARVGGAEIPFVWREVHGYDLMGAAFRIALGRPVPPPVDLVPTDRARGGWLLVPAPTERPCLITESTDMLGRPDGPYAQVVLAPGQILPAADAFYEHVGGRFRFRGRTSAAVEMSVIRTAADFRVVGRAVTGDSSFERVRIER